MSRMFGAIFGPFLRHTRLHRGVSQEQLADKIGCHRTHIWRLEHDQRRPSRTILRLLPHTFALTTAESAVLKAFEEMLVYRYELIDVAVPAKV